MSSEPQSEPRQPRATVLLMPPRAPQPAAPGRPVVPSHDHAEDEPGYGHGV